MSANLRTKTPDFRKWLLVYELQAHETAAAHCRRLNFSLREGFDLQAYASRASRALRAGEDYLAHRRSCAGREAYRNDVKLLNLLAKWAGHRGVHWDMPPRKRVDLPIYAQGDVARLLNVEDHQAAALAQFSIGTGLRRGEVAQFRDEDVHVDRLEYRVRCPTKDGPPRTLRFADPRILEPGQPFGDWLGRRGRGRLWDGTVQQVGSRLWLAGRRCGVLASFQRGRRTFATSMHRAGASLTTIQHYLGHANIEITRHYLKLDAVDARRELEILQPRLPILTDDYPRSEVPVPA